MLDLFIGLKRVTKRRKIHIDNAVFRLHWLFTSAILIGFSIILSGRQYVGDPILCMETNNLPRNLINTYCWIQSTFIIPESTKGQSSDSETAHPWIGNSAGSRQRVKFQTYYQWVCFALFFQGVLCYFPYYLWKIWEGGLMRLISMGMQIALLTEEERGHKRKIILDYFYRHFGHHRLYAYKYFFCECLCLVNICGQLWFNNWFLDGQFINYGPQVLDWAVHFANQSEISNPMNRMFPRMTKCRFKKYGDSGDISNYDILCLLPLNIVNEKIYLFIWFWYFALLLLMTMVIVYRIFIFVAVRLRAYFLKSRCQLSTTKSLKLICEKGNIGDWFLMYMLANNLDPLLIKDITDEISRRLEKGMIKKDGPVS